MMFDVAENNDEDLIRTAIMCVLNRAGLDESHKDLVCSGLRPFIAGVRLEEPVRVVLRPAGKQSTDVSGGAKNVLPIAQAVMFIMLKNDMVEDASSPYTRFCHVCQNETTFGLGDNLSKDIENAMKSRPTSAAFTSASGTMNGTVETAQPARHHLTPVAALPQTDSTPCEAKNNRSDAEPANKPNERPPNVTNAASSSAGQCSADRSSDNENKRKWRQILDKKNSNKKRKTKEREPCSSTRQGAASDTLTPHAAVEDAFQHEQHQQDKKKLAENTADSSAHIQVADGALTSHAAVEGASQREQSQQDEKKTEEKKVADDALTTSHAAVEDDRRHMKQQQSDKIKAKHEKIQREREVRQQDTIREYQTREEGIKLAYFQPGSESRAQQKQEHEDVKDQELERRPSLEQPPREKTDLEELLGENIGEELLGGPEDLGAMGESREQVHEGKGGGHDANKSSPTNSDSSSSSSSGSSSSGSSEDEAGDGVLQTYSIEKELDDEMKG